MDYWKDIPSGGKAPEVVNIVVETPLGNRNKYEYNKEECVFTLNRVLYSSVHYPMDYGFIPQTIYDDGDPLDAMVLVYQPTFSGCVLEARPVGLMEMDDGGEKDNKILAVPLRDPRFNEIKDIKNVPKHILDEIAQFFREYKNLEGKKTIVLGWGNVKSAKREIRKAMKNFSCRSK